MFNYFKISKFFLFLAPLCIILVSSSTLFPFIVSKYVWFRTSVDLALIFFLLGLLFNQRESAGININQRLLALLKQPLIIAVTVFVIIFLLASFFSVDPKMSFWSNFERGEGGFQLLHLWLFFVLLAVLFKEEKDWRKLFVIGLIGGVLMAFYGFGAGLGQPGFLGPLFGAQDYRFQGSIGNPAYVASYAIFMMFYAFYLLVSKYRQKLFSGGAIVLWLLLIFFFIIFWLAATRGAFVGLIAALVAGVGYFIYVHKVWRKWLLLGMVIILLAVGLLIYFRDTPLVKAIPGSRLFQLTVSAETWLHRTYMWKTALDGWKERPILGWGPENYLKIFDRHFNIKYFEADKPFSAWFDRAHSIYFDYLAATGILGLLSFLSIWLVFYRQFFSKALMNQFQKTQPSEIKSQHLESSTSQILEFALIFALPIAYLVQGIVLFDVLPIYLNLFLFLAFANYRFQILSIKTLKIPNSNRQIPNNTNLDKSK